MGFAPAILTEQERENFAEYLRRGYHGDMGLGHFVIPTAQFDETYKFYTQVLGFGQTDYMQFQFAPEAPQQGLHFLQLKLS